MPAASAASVVSPVSAIWVANEKDHSLTRLDAQAQSVTLTVPTCKRPRHIEAWRDVLLVACSGSDAIGVVDPLTGALLRQLPASADPETFALSPDGRRLYAASEDKGELVIVDLEAGTITARVPVGGEPEGVAASPDGRLVFVTSETDHHIAVVDVAKAAVIGKIAAGKRPRRLVWVDHGRELWAGNEREGTISIIDPLRLAVKETLVLPTEGLPTVPMPAGMVASADGGTVYVGLGRANHVAVIDVARRAVRAMVPAGQRIWGVALSGDGGLLLAAGSLSHDVTVIDTATLKPLRTLAVGQSPQALVAWQAPGGGRPVAPTAAAASAVSPAPGPASGLISPSRPADSPRARP